MSNPIDEVIRERETQKAKLDSRLDDKGQRPKSRRYRGRVERQAKERGDGIGTEGEVRCASKSDAGDSGPGRGAEPDLADLVDAEVRGDGPVEALFDEYVVAFFGAHSHDGRWASGRHVRPGLDPIGWEVIVSGMGGVKCTVSVATRGGRQPAWECPA